MELSYGKIAPLRALVSECLPFELPVEMNGRWLYEWLECRAVRVNGEGLLIRTKSKSDAVMLSMLGAVPFGNRVDGTPGEYKLASHDSRWRAPAGFRVRRDKLRTRDLDLLAVRSQLNFAFVYFGFKDVMLYYTSRDRGALRRPSRANSMGKHPNSQILSEVAAPSPTIELEDKGLPTYNSFFVYERFAFVGQFYDSRQWQALEAKWNYLRRLDVSNCFRNIYSHSLAWSTGTDFFSKQHLGGKQKRSGFGERFDAVMQQANWGETHGICVGPEASRVFAEVVFQHLALQIHDRLRREKGLGRYEILRYVDDFFVFAQEGGTLDKVARTIELVLSEHRFSLNHTKTRDYVTPFTTSISVKKVDLKEFLMDALPEAGPWKPFDRRHVGVKLKSLLVEAADEAAAVGAALAQIEKSLTRFLSKRMRAARAYDEANDAALYGWDFVHNLVFLYLSHPTVATAMKIVRILRVYLLSHGLLAKDIERRAALLFRAEEYVRFAVNKILDRLLEHPSTELELCHFLSLLEASGIEFDYQSSTFQNLMLRLEEGAESFPRARENQGFVFLLLSSCKAFLGDSDLPPFERERLLDVLDAVGEQLLGDGFVPDIKIKSHASQELFVLALFNCPHLRPAELSGIVSRAWLLKRIAAQLLGGVSQVAEAGKLLEEAIVAREQQPEPMFMETTIFEWDGSKFDKLISEKEPQFIY